MPSSYDFSKQKHILAQKLRKSDLFPKNMKNRPFFCWPCQNKSASDAKRFFNCVRPYRIIIIMVHGYIIQWGTQLRTLHTSILWLHQDPTRTGFATLGFFCRCRMCLGQRKARRSSIRGTVSWTTRRQWRSSRRRFLPRRSKRRRYLQRTRQWTILWKYQRTQGVSYVVCYSTCWKFRGISTSKFLCYFVPRRDFLRSIASV